jgi:hypothetical protein
MIGPMHWPFRRRDPAPGPRLPHARPVDGGDFGDSAAVVFVCSTCGRTDLAEAGDWHPPICAECDAAINFDALAEEMDDNN